MRAAIVVAIAIALVPVAADAHVGSPDVFFEGDAGPYRVFVTVRPPDVIPGVAEVQIRAASPDVTRLRIVPLPLTGDGAKFAPTPDVATPLAEDPQLYTGHLWMMTPGAWQVRVLVDGAQGTGELAVPVPTLPTRMRGMQTVIGILLALSLVILAVGIVSIVGAYVREAGLEPGGVPDAAAKRRARRPMAVTAVLVALVLFGGSRWWSAEAASYESNVYKARPLVARVDGGQLVLEIPSSDWQISPQADDLLPDHGHLMHLFVIAMPDLDRIWHLHPTRTEAGKLSQPLPAMPAGRYHLFADIVHDTGVAETLEATLDLPADLAGTPLAGDDSTGSVRARGDANTVSLEGGGQIVWQRDAAPLEVRRPTWFRFRVEDAPGQPTGDLELYMGMLGHAAFIRRDLAVFAHLHPSGSVPMAQLAIVQPDHMAHHHHEAQALPSEVAFPWGFPSPGDYRIFVQVKRRGRIETAAFDAHVN